MIAGGDRLRQEKVVWDQLLEEWGSGLPVATGLHLGEAVATVDGPVLSGQEGDLSAAPAIGANGLVHGARAAAVAAATFATTRLAAIRATPRVLIATAGVELLVLSGKSELLATLSTSKDTVFESQLNDLLSRLRSGPVIELVSLRTDAELQRTRAFGLHLAKNVPS